MQEDFARHNEEQQQVWASFRAGNPIRVPVMIGCNPRMLLLDPALNPDGITFEQYMTDPQVHLDVLLRFHHWLRHTLRFDQEMGLPADGWKLCIDLQNIYEAGWLGAPVYFPETNCPYAAPLLDDDRRNLLFDRGVPDPLDDGGWMTRNWTFYDHVRERIDSGWEYQGRPIAEVEPAGINTDGPFTIAVELRGHEVCADMLADPDYFHQLMDFITEATIARMRAFRERLGLPIRSHDYGYADDSIALISEQHFRDHVLPYHRRLVETFWTGEGSLSIHLCGDASRLFPILNEELGVTAFDTGFPIDLHDMRKQLGPDVLLQGGPTAERLRSGPVEDIRKETRDLLTGPVKEGRFILREANNLAPCTPPEHVAAMYETVRAYGRYDT